MPGPNRPQNSGKPELGGSSTVSVAFNASVAGALKRAHLRVLMSPHRFRGFFSWSSRTMTPRYSSEFLRFRVHVGARTFSNCHNPEN